jgi:hypothetical protein
VVPGQCRLALIALGARGLALHHRDKVVVAMTLVVLFFLFARGRSLAMVPDLFPLSLRGVQCRGTASSPSAWLLVMSRSSRVVRGMRRLSQWMREVQVVSF